MPRRYPASTRYHARSERSRPVPCSYRSTISVADRESVGDGRGDGSDQAQAAPRIGPRHEELREVEQRIADRRELPVDDRGEVAVAAKMHVPEVVVAVQDPDLFAAGRWASSQLLT